jgi:hypothetical protein
MNEAYEAEVMKKVDEMELDPRILVANRTLSTQRG